MSQDPDPRSKPPCQYEDALAILHRLRNAGHVAYFAGGCVRDLLLKLEPKDYDIATDASPDRVRDLFSNTQSVGAAFGVILVRHRRSVIEVATFRAEGPYLDGRRPSQVQFTSAEEDAKRRDFTINGLFFDPLNQQVIDYVNGQADLTARRIRAIGDPAARFEEDHLRLLRAVRFAARFAFEIEPATAVSIRQFAPLLRRISPERIADELRDMLTPPTRTTAWHMLWDFALIDIIFRMLPSSESVEFDASRSIFLALAPSQSISFPLALAAGSFCYRSQSLRTMSDLRFLLSNDEILKTVRAMRQSLKISNEESNYLHGTLEGASLLLTDSPPTLVTKKRFLARPTAALSRQLLDAFARIGLYQQRIDSLRTDLSNLDQTFFAPPPLLNGDDLTTIGLTPGPLFKHLLAEAYDAQLEDKIHTREQAIELVKKLAAEMT